MQSFEYISRQDLGYLSGDKSHRRHCMGPITIKEKNNTTCFIHVDLITNMLLLLVVGRAFCVFCFHMLTFLEYPK